MAAAAAARTEEATSAARFFLLRLLDVPLHMHADSQALSNTEEALYL